MENKSVLLLYCFTAIAGSAVTDSHVVHIVHSKEDFPYHVQLGTDQRGQDKPPSVLCGGTLISLG